MQSQIHGQRILHLISSAGLLGAERVLLELALETKQAGFKVSIGVFENSRNPNLALGEEAKALGLEVEIFPCKGRFDKNTIQMIRGYLEKKFIQIIHSHNYKSNFYARKAIRRNDVRWVVTNHGRRFGPTLFFYNLLDAFLVRKADRLIAVSGEIADKMRLAGIRKERICLIENGININRFTGNGSGESVKESLGIKKEARVIASVGSLTKEKGHAYLCEAAPRIIERFPEAIFLLVGDGLEREGLEQKAVSLKIRGKVIFAGMRKDIPEILSMVDVFVLPSLLEGLPIALLEAQAAKVPIIATSVGAIPKVVDDGVTGILIPPKAPEAIEKAIIRILSNKKASQEMAEKGFEKVKDIFSSEKMAAKYFSVYKELIS